MTQNPFNCPGCQQRLRTDAPVCGPCWKKLPVPLRDAWLKVTGLDGEEKAVRAIAGHFGAVLEFVRGRRTFPASVHGTHDLYALLECSPFFKWDERGGGQRWNCQGCDQPACKRDESLCPRCFARLPRRIRDAWTRGGMEEDGPAWDAVVVWLENNQPETELETA